MPKLSYAGYRFPPEVIRQAIWLYLRFTLSLRDVEDLLAERGIAVSYETVRRWVNHFGPIIASDWRKRRPRPHSTWHLDEVFLKIDGRMVYLWRAVDAEGEVLDVLVRSRRDKHAALKLMRKLLKKHAIVPERLVTDNLRSYGAAARDLGVVPLGYRVQDRALHIVEQQAELVRELSRRYLEVGSVVRLKEVLDAENVRLPLRTDGTGKTMEGGLISRGHLYNILSNPIYVGRLGHKGQFYEGQQAAIVDLSTWDDVQGRLAQHTQRKTKLPQQKSEALLAGKLFDDRGHRMSPSFAARGGRRWRYYVSQALQKGRMSEAGSLARVSAAEIEKQVADAITSHLGVLLRSIGTGEQNTRGGGPAEAADETESAIHHNEIALDTLRDAIERVTLSKTAITSLLAESATGESLDRTLTLLWTPPSTRRRREIHQGEGDPDPLIHPMRVKACEGLIAALCDAHRWLDELLSDPRCTVKAIAAREGKTERSIRMTLSLAFLAPGIVEAGVEGRLPRGFGVTRLTDLPMAWSKQWTAQGLAAPAST